MIVISPYSDHNIWLNIRMYAYSPPSFTVFPSLITNSNPTLSSSLLDVSSARSPVSSPSYVPLFPDFSDIPTNPTWPGCLVLDCTYRLDRLSCAASSSLPSTSPPQSCNQPAPPPPNSAAPTRLAALAIFPVQHPPRFELAPGIFLDEDGGRRRHLNSVLFCLSAAVATSIILRVLLHSPLATAVRSIALMLAAARPRMGM